MSSSGFKVLKSNHTGLTVSNLERSLAFWHELLSFPILYQHVAAGTIPSTLLQVPNAEIKVAMLQIPGSDHRIELEEYTSPSAAEQKVFKPRCCDVGSVHVALEVKGLDALLEKIKAADWVSLSEPQGASKGRYAGWRLVFIRGPDGETVELMEPPIET